jgi:uncharacterized protein (TIGR02646 family)
VRQIIKVQGREPVELTAWKKANQGKRYQDLQAPIRQAIRRAAIKEQFGLCGYCCQRIDESNSNNEHVISQQSDKNQTLNFANIIASCNKKGRCNEARKSKEIPLTPLMPECEFELKFYLSGKLEGGTIRATEAINSLGLDNRAIREERKNLVDQLIFIEGSSPNELQLLGDELLKDLISTLDKPDDSGMLLAHSPALINIIRGFLKKS